jgi:hypothetical protein
MNARVVEASKAEGEQKRKSEREGTGEREGRREGRRRTTTNEKGAHTKRAHTHTHTHPQRTHKGKARKPTRERGGRNHTETQEQRLDSETYANGECANPTRTCRACAARGASKQASNDGEARRSGAEAIVPEPYMRAKKGEKFSRLIF